MERFADAAELHISEGRVYRAIEVFLRDYENSHSMSRAIKVLLDGLWENASFGVPLSLIRSNEPFNKLIKLSGKLNVELIESADHDEVKACVHGSNTKLTSIRSSCSKYWLV